MDKITFDFENGKIIFETDAQQGVESCPDLWKRKNTILAAAGYEPVDLIREMQSLGLGDLIGHPVEDDE